jgi:hypothetical protein
MRHPVCLGQITVGGLRAKRALPPAYLENIMLKMQNSVLSVALLVSVLALSACATKQKEEAVVEPAPAAAVAEKAPAPEQAPAPATVAEQAAPAPAASTAEVAPKPAVKKAKKKVAKAAPPPAPVAAPAPAPVVKQEAPVAAPPAPTPPPVVAPPVQPVAEKGFLEKYWLWLVGLIIAVVAVLWMKKKD